MRPVSNLFYALAVALIGSTAANAATVTVQRDVGVQVVSEFGMSSGTSTHGQHLDGMLITANYLDGTTEELVWKAYSGHGDVTGVGLYISKSWDAFKLTATKRLKSLYMDAGAAGAIFDTLFLGEYDDGNTTGTSYGFSYREIDPNALSGEIKVTYSGLMSIRGSEAQGDVYTHMLIDFSGLEDGGLLGYTEFETDLDSLAVKGDLAAVSEVPLPAGMPLLLAGLGALGLYRRKHR